jgi:iron complex transport system ATP-binding protein
MSPVLEASALTLRRGAARVLSSVSLALAPGEHLALLGRNGSGKTTLLRALAGLDAPEAGQLRWSGAPLPRGAARAQAIGVLFQSEPASAWTARELVTLGLALDGPAGPQARAHVKASLEREQLTPLADRPTAELSGGEAQRTRLARARVAAAPLLLLDEPTLHLDPAHQAAFCAWLQDAPEALVLATHDLALAARCHRVALLVGGRVLKLGTPDEVLTAPLLAEALGIHTRRVVDPQGGPPLFQLLGAAA